MWFIHPSANGHQSAHRFRCQGAARTGKEGSLIEDTDLRNKRWDPWGDKSAVVLRCFVATCESVNLLSFQSISYNQLNQRISSMWDTKHKAFAMPWIWHIWYRSKWRNNQNHLLLQIPGAVLHIYPSGNHLNVQFPPKIFIKCIHFLKNTLKQYETVMNIIPP